MNLLTCLYKFIVRYFFNKNIKTSYFQIRWDSRSSEKEYLVLSELSRGFLVQVKDRSEGTRGTKCYSYRRLAELNDDIYVLNQYHFVGIRTNGLIKAFFIELLGLKRAKYRWLYRKQFDFNAKPLIKKDRHMILKIIVEKQLSESRARFHHLNVMGYLEGKKWMYHPNKSRDLSFIKFCLESWAETGELIREKDNGWFKLGPKAIETIERMEREEQVHQDNVHQAKHIKYLTICLVVVGVVQAIATAYQAFKAL